MNVFVAGATGAIGIPTVRALIAAGHSVTGMTRTRSKRALLEELGARPVVADALDETAVRDAVVSSEPEVVIQLLTALPIAGPLQPSDLAQTNLLRMRATPLLLAAASDAGARTYVAESIAFMHGYADRIGSPTDEETPIQPTGDRRIDEAVHACLTLEGFVTSASRIRGIVLRFGFYYGPQTGNTRALMAALRAGTLALPDAGASAWIHVDDAARAVMAALEPGVPSGVYNIVDDEPMSTLDAARALARATGSPQPGTIPLQTIEAAAPYAALVLGARVAPSNAKAKRLLRWNPRYASVRDGARSVAAEGTNSGQTASTNA
ncbi:MAG TPA: NAD(P)-dependent oxidoreductase [Actinomycetota bacterium]|nr:NAD(P)-dependent oxidoreductase [Actinomycetota bacterium]